MRSRPPRDLLAAVVDAVAPGGAVVRTRRLKGGISAAVHRVDLRDARGEAVAVVVRRYDAHARWFRPERVTREVAVLRSLAPTPVPSPAVLLVDESRHTIVQSYLAGRSINPSGDERWATRLCTALATIHDEDTTVEAEDWLRDWALDDPPAYVADRPDVDRLWCGLRAVAPDLLAERRTLAHHDFHFGNTVWRRGNLVGIVDWENAGLGYPSYDAVYCAFDASLAKGRDAGERVLAAYEAIVGRRTHPGWRLAVALRALPDVAHWAPAYAGVGIVVSADELRARVEDWIADGLRSVS